MPRPFAVPVTLSEEERAVLVGWTRRPKTAQALAFRARVILAAAEPGATNTGIAAALRTTKMTVAKWRGRFAARGLEGLSDEPRPGAKRTITDAQGNAVLTATLETKPPDATQWSTRPTIPGRPVLRLAPPRPHEPDDRSGPNSHSAAQPLRCSIG